MTIVLLERGRELFLPHHAPLYVILEVLAVITDHVYISTPSNTSVFDESTHCSLTVFVYYL